MKKHYPETIKPNFSYRVKYTKDHRKAVILDGQEILFVAEVRNYRDYIIEVVNQDNEMARLYEVFKTALGNTFLYWRDDEADADYITKVTDED